MNKDSVPLPDSEDWIPDSPELVAYYADRKLLVRNVTLIGLCNLSWNIAFKITGPLITLRMLELGIRENIQATFDSINKLLYCFLIMFFAWTSDHTVSKLGRRKPYLFASAPLIILSTVIFPFIDDPAYLWLIVVFWIVKLLAMDLKSSTFPMLNTDCVPRPLLARANSVFTIATGLVGFFAMQCVGPLLEIAEWVPFVLAGGVMAITTITAYWIKEPPIFYPAKEPFKFWSTFKIAAADKRIFLLMAAVALANCYFLMQETWIWFWAKETLGLERKEIFEALSWAGLINVGLAYPTAWLIDRWGAIKVATIYFIGQIACFAMVMNVSDKAGLVVLSLVSTVVAPLYAAIDFMVYKKAPAKDVGSIIATNAAIRNAWHSIFGAAAGWLIFWCNHNYNIGYILGIVASSAGFTVLWFYHWLMNRSPSTDRREE